MHIVYKPMKVGWLAGGLFVELHPPLDDDLGEYEIYLQRVLDAVSDMIAAHPEWSEINDNRRLHLDGAALRKAVAEKSGIPVLITR